MNICNNGVFHFLANNLKSPEFIFCLRPNYLFVMDKSSETCRVQFRAESLEFRAVALGDEFDAAIGEIADGAGDFKAGGDGLGGVAEAHPLHAAGVNELQSAAGGMGRLI